MWLPDRYTSSDVRNAVLKMLVTSDAVLGTWVKVTVILFVLLIGRAVLVWIEHR